VAAAFVRALVVLVVVGADIAGTALVLVEALVGIADLLAIGEDKLNERQRRTRV
jgi:energy-converting hydrogenase Eha subunit G